MMILLIERDETLFLAKDFCAHPTNVITMEMFAKRIEALLTKDVVIVDVA